MPTDPLEALNRRLDSLDQDIVFCTTQLDRVVDVLETHRQRLDAVEAHPGAGAAEPGASPGDAGLGDAGPGAPGPQVWPPYADLETWVDQWLIPTFDLQQVLADWHQRPSYRSELVGVYLGYTHLTGHPGPFDAMQFHSHLEATISRIRRYHREPTSSGGLDAITGFLARG